MSFDFPVHPIRQFWARRRLLPHEALASGSDPDHSRKTRDIPAQSRYILDSTLPRDCFSRHL
jgi:hypothetical protein